MRRREEHPHDQVSPISFASKVRTPVLIVPGQDDTASDSRELTN